MTGREGVRLSAVAGSLMSIASSAAPAQQPSARGPRGDSVEWVTARVVGRETVAAGSGKSVLAYVTVANTSAGEFKFWMSAEAPYVIRLVVTGPRGGQEIFEMD